MPALPGLLATGALVPGLTAITVRTTLGLNETDTPILDATNFTNLPSGGAFGADSQTQITPSTAIVLDEATGNEKAIDLSYTTNKATSGDDTGIYVNHTDTASPGTSLLMDLQVGGTTKFKVWSAGYVSIGTFRMVPNGNSLILQAGGVSNTAAVLSSGIQVSSVGYFGITGTANAQDAADVRLYRGAANTLSQRNGTNAQTSWLTNTYTSTTNHERLVTRAVAAANFEIGPAKGSVGGTLRGLTIGGYADESAAITPWLTFDNAGDATFAGNVTLGSARKLYFAGGTVTQIYESGGLILESGHSARSLKFNVNFVRQGEFPTTGGFKVENGVGFFGATPPASQPAAIADATDAASNLTATNAILAVLRANGMIAT